jgi:hypothetical protein
MEANVKAVEQYQRNKEEKFVKVTFDPDNFGVAILYYPWEMASLFPLGKRVEITVSEARDPQHELLRRIEQQREYEQGV